MVVVVLQGISPINAGKIGLIKALRAASCDGHGPGREQSVTYDLRPALAAVEDLFDGRTVAVKVDPNSIQYLMDAGFRVDKEYHKVFCSNTQQVIMCEKNLTNKLVRLLNKGVS